MSRRLHGKLKVTLLTTWASVDLRTLPPTSSHSYQPLSISSVGNALPEGPRLWPRQEAPHRVTQALAEGREAPREGPALPLTAFLIVKENSKLSAQPVVQLFPQLLMLEGRPRAAESAAPSTTPTLLPCLAGDPFAARAVRHLHSGEELQRARNLQAPDSNPDCPCVHWQPCTTGFTSLTCGPPSPSFGSTLHSS